MANSSELKETLFKYTTQDPGLWPLISLDTWQNTNAMTDISAYSDIKTIVAPLSPTEAPNLFQINLILKLAQCLHDGFNIEMIFKCQSKPTSVDSSIHNKFLKYLIELSDSPENYDASRYCTQKTTPLEHSKKVEEVLDKTIEKLYGGEDIRTSLALKEMFSLLIYVVGESQKGKTNSMCLLFGETEFENWNLARRLLIEATADDEVRTIISGDVDLLKRLKFLTLPSFSNEDGYLLFDINDSEISIQSRIFDALNHSKDCVRLMNELSCFFGQRTATSNPSWLFTDWNPKPETMQDEISSFFDKEIKEKIKIHKDAWFQDKR